MSIVKDISDLLSDAYGKVIVVGGRTYIIKAPSIKIIMRAARYLSRVNIDKASAHELMSIVPENLTNIAKGLSCLVVGDAKCYQKKIERIEQQMLSGTEEELVQAYLVALELIIGKDFFGACQLAMELANLAIKLKS